MSVFEPNSRNLREFRFSAFIRRKLRLRLIGFSQVFTARLLLVKGRVVSGFNVSRAVILMSRTGTVVEKRKFWKILNWKHHLLKTRAKRKNNWQNHWEKSIRHFETPQSHENDSEARKLCSLRVEAERCWTAFLCLWTAASKTESEGVFTSQLWSAKKNGSTMIIPSAENHGKYPDIPPCGRPDQIFTVLKLYSAFGGTSSVWCIMSCLNRVKPSQGIGIECNYCVWAEYWRRNGHSTRRDTTKLSSSMTMLGHMSQDLLRQGADLHKGNIGICPGRRLKEGGKNEGLCAFFFKILEYKFSILKNQKI